MRRATIVVILGVGALGGCGRLLGLEQDYVLREPIRVRLGGGRETVTVPAGTRVKQVSFKDDTAFVEISGHASRRQLEAAGEPK